MVKDESFAEEPVRSGDQPQQIRRVGNVYDIEPVANCHPCSEQRVANQAGGVLGHMSREAAAEGGLRIMIDAHAVAYSAAAPSRSRADYGHGPASSAQCVSLSAHASIETVRNVLDQKQDTELFAGHVFPLKSSSLPSRHGHSCVAPVCVVSCLLQQFGCVDVDPIRFVHPVRYRIAGLQRCIDQVCESERGRNRSRQLEDPRFEDSNTAADEELLARLFDIAANTRPLGDQLPERQLMKFMVARERDVASSFAVQGGYAIERQLSHQVGEAEQYRPAATFDRSESAGVTERMLLLEHIEIEAGHIHRDLAEEITKLAAGVRDDDRGALHAARRNLPQQTADHRLLANCQQRFRQGSGDRSYALPAAAGLNHRMHG